MFVRKNSFLTDFCLNYSSRDTNRFPRALISKSIYEVTSQMEMEQMEKMKIREKSSDELTLFLSLR